MAGYVIADVNVTNAAAYEEYRKLVPASIQKYADNYMRDRLDFQAEQTPA